MRIESTMLVSITALALAFSAGSALAARRHHHHHHHYRHAMRPAAMQVRQDTSAGLIVNANNPAKRYPVRHDSNLLMQATLSTSGNNPTKRYKVTHGSNLLMQTTLSRKGNNPAKYYAGH